MAKFEVTMSLMVHALVQVQVEAETKEAATDAAYDLMPRNSDMSKVKGWKAQITLAPPHTITLSKYEVKANHFEMSSGGEKVKKIG